MSEPFFAFVHYREPHLPLRPPAPYDRAFVPPNVDPNRLRSELERREFTHFAELEGGRGTAFLARKGGAG